MGTRIGCSLVLLLLASPVLSQPPGVYLPPPVVNAPIVPPPPLEPGLPGYASPPGPLPLGGCDPGPEGWSIFGPCSAPTALLMNWDFTVLQPHIKNNLAVNPGVPTVFDYGSLLDASLNWTAAPRLELGYRLPESQGAFLIGYRYMGSEGTSTQGTTAIRSRFNLNVVDFIYETERIRPWGDWFIYTRLGGRMAGSFYDTQNVTGNFTQSESNNFFGGGLLGALDIEKRFDMIPGLALYSNLESSILVGQIQQNFSTTFPGFAERVEQQGSQAVQTIQVQAGFSYVPPALQNLRFRAAYQYEHWFDLGQLRNSSLDMNGHGAFLRMELTY